MQKEINENLINLKEEILKDITERMNILNKITFLLSSNDLKMNIDEVANFYNVNKKYIEKIYKQYKDDFEEDDIIIQNNLFSKKSILKMAMFIKNNDIAKEVRTQLLNIQKYSIDEINEILDKIAHYISLEKQGIV